jgi:hypothetical protein
MIRRTLTTKATTRRAVRAARASRAARANGIRASNATTDRPGIDVTVVLPVTATSQSAGLHLARPAAAPAAAAAAAGSRCSSSSCLLLRAVLQVPTSILLSRGTACRSRWAGKEGLDAAWLRIERARRALHAAPGAAPALRGAARPVRPAGAAGGRALRLWPPRKGPSCGLARAQRASPRAPRKGTLGATRWPQSACRRAGGAGEQRVVL